jgi:hypothetical protein
MPTPEEDKAQRSKVAGCSSNTAGLPGAMPTRLPIREEQATEIKKGGYIHWLNPSGNGVHNTAWLTPFLACG